MTRKLPLIKRFVIAIDGPAASGKSSAAKALARRLGCLYLDTGALYRAIAWKMLEQKVNLGSASKVRKACQSIQIRLFLTGEKTEVWVDGQNVTSFLRLPDVTKAASKVSEMPAVRDKLLFIQREIGREGSVVAEGRDIGTVVFPEAAIKFYLDAALSVRGKRRHKDLSQSGSAVNLTETTGDLKSRDISDTQRRIAPLKQGEDAILIDSTVLSLESVVDEMLREVDQVLSSPGETPRISLQ